MIRRECHFTRVCSGAVVRVLVPGHAVASGPRVRRGRPGAPLCQASCARVEELRREAAGVGDREEADREAPTRSDVCDSRSRVSETSRSTTLVNASCAAGSTLTILGRSPAWRGPRRGDPCGSRGGLLAVVRMRGILATKFGDERPWRAASSHASPHRFRLVPCVAAFLAARYFFEFGTRVPGASGEPQDGWRCLGRTLWRVHHLPRSDRVNAVRSSGYTVEKRVRPRPRGSLAHARGVWRAWRRSA